MMGKTQVSMRCWVLIGLVCLLGFLLAGCKTSVVTETPSGTRKASPEALPSLTLTPVAATNTPLPTPTQTPLPTNSYTPTARPTQTKRPTATPILPTPTIILPFATVIPADGPGAYKLKGWSEADFLQAISEARQITKNTDSLNWDSPYYINDFSEYLITLEREYLLRYPGSTSYSQIAWNLVSLEIQQGYGLRSSSQYTFRTLLLDALNTGQATPENLNDWLNERGFGVVSFIPADNLTGDGQSAWVFQVRLYDAMSVFALTMSISGEYDLTKIFPQDPFSWGFVLWGDLKTEIGDHNGNGQPEVSVMTYYYGIGVSTFMDYDIYLFEWQKDIQAFLNLTEYIPTLYLDRIAQVIDPDNPYPWKFRAQDGSDTETITATIKESFIDDKSCPLPVYQIIYTWDGFRYQWSEEGFLSYDQSAPQICQVGWALMTGDWNEAAIPILVNALNNWSEDYDAEWGPAAKDYLRLRLGIIYSFHGKSEPALQALRLVRDYPDHPKFNMASTLAREFLSNYKTDQTVTACMKTTGLLNNRLDGLMDLINSGVDTVPLGIVKEQWGIVDPFWIWDGSAICNLPTSFQQSLRVVNPSNTRQLVEWLNHSGIGWGPLAKADLDGNEVEDWLVTVKFQTERHWSILGLIRDGQNIYPINIASTWAEHPVLTTDILHLDMTEQPIILMQTSDSINIFIIRKASGKLHLETTHLEDVVFLFSNNLSQNDIVSMDDRTITLSNKIYRGYYSQNDIEQTIYKWNSDAQVYKWKETIPSRSEQVIQSAEKAVFVTNETRNAIIMLRELLAGDFRETVTAWDERGIGEGPERIRPYVQYLLGLAYELSGDESQAVQAYWQLWHEFPDDPYALAARAKLELTK